MKSVTPASYSKIFLITPSGATVEPNRGLLITTSVVSSITVTDLYNASQQIQNIPANTVFVLPLAVYKVTAVTAGCTAYGLL
jgi:ABC-type amino acid transport system permease subunit